MSASSAASLLAGSTSSSLPAQLDLPAIRASLTASIAAPSVECSPRRSPPGAAARRSSRHALVKSITKRLRCMKTMLHSQHGVEQRHPSQCSEADQCDVDEGSEAEKENEACEAAQPVDDAGSCHLDTTAEERPSTADSDIDTRSSRRVASGTAKRPAAAAAVHWQRMVVALNTENEQLRAAVSSEREAAASLTAAARHQLEVALDKQARRYDSIIQERDDEIGQLRALIREMNHTLLNNTQQLIDAHTELDHTAAAPHGSQSHTDRADDDGDTPGYPTLTPGSSPLLSPNKLTVLLDDTQDVIAFDASLQSAHKLPVVAMSPIRGGGAVLGSGGSTFSARTVAVVAPAVVDSAASPLTSVFEAAAADANQLAAAWQRYLDVNQVERETQLAQLPLTSPSTPDSKRRRVAAHSPLAAAVTRAASSGSKQATPRSIHGSAVLSSVQGVSHSRSHTSLGGPHDGAVKQLHFHLLESVSEPRQYEGGHVDGAHGSFVLQTAAVAHRRAESATVLEVKSSGGGTSPTHRYRVRQQQERLRAGFTGSHTRGTAETEEGGDGGSGSGSDVTSARVHPVEGSLTVAAECEAEADSAVCLSGSEARRVSAELRRLRVLLDVKNEWNVRMAAMSGIELLSRESGVGRWSEWSRELEALRPLLCDQLTDLRSSIVREACRVLVALATASRLHFEREVDVYFPLLFKGLFVTIRVIRDSCDECLQALTQRTASVRCLPALLSGCSDVHAVVRDKCAAYINTLIVAAAASSCTAEILQLEPHSSDIGATIGRLVQDSDHGTRATARQLYRTFSKHFSGRAAAVHSHFPLQVQKALDAERRAGANKQSVLASKKKK